MTDEELAEINRKLKEMTDLERQHALDIIMDDICRYCYTVKEGRRCYCTCDD